MARTLVHRGPDGDGYYVDPSHAVGLAHRRLAIIDVGGGAQPIANEDGTIQVIFNGEIFNYLELRADLAGRGHAFTTRTDTEVLVHLYEERGDEFVHALNGQFALALWDARRRRLLLARDRPGILPLYYHRTPGELLFASEMKGILAALDRRPPLNPDALRQTLALWSPLAPDTIFDGIVELEPGQMLTIDDSGPRTRRYWSWTLARDGEARTGAPADLAAELSWLVDDATRLRLRADVPVGAYLSGGLDSSLLTSLASRAAGDRLQTFSIGFDDAAFDETRFQREVIDATGVAHSRIACSPDTIAATFLDVVRAAETPLTRSGPAPMFLLSKHVRASGVPVVLTGEGADEVLGGYDLFKETKIRAFCARDRASARRPLLFKRLYPYLDFTRQQPAALLASYFDAPDRTPCQPAYSHASRLSAGRWAESLLTGEIRSAGSPGSPEDWLVERQGEYLRNRGVFHRAQHLEARTLMAGYLLSSQGDRMLMAHSVEGRFPYLDHRVIEFANALDPRLKMRVLREKWLLKQAARAHVPAAVLDRPKQPYRAPDVTAFVGPHAPEYARVLTAPAMLRQYGYFDDRRVLRLTQKLERAVAAGAPVSHRDSLAWMTMLSTQAWHFLFQER